MLISEEESEYLCMVIRVYVSFKVYMNTDVLQLNYKIFLRKTKKTVQVKRRQRSRFEGKNILFNVLPVLTASVYFSAGHHTYTV